MVGVAQLVEHLVVAQVVARSIRVTHPKIIRGRLSAPFFMCNIVILLGCQLMSHYCTYLFCNHNFFQTAGIRSIYGQVCH